MPRMPPGRKALAGIEKSTDYHQVDVTADGPLAELLAQLEGPVAVYFALPPHISQKACEVLHPGSVARGHAAGDGETVRIRNRVSAAAEQDPGRPGSRRTTSIAWTTSWARPPCSISWACASPTGSWSRCGTGNTSKRWRSSSTKTSLLEGRARYYDGAGALRDMIQSHLLHIMALLAIDAPASIGERDLRDAIATVLRASSITAPYASPPAGRATQPAGSAGRDVPGLRRRSRAWTLPGKRRRSPRSKWTSTLALEGRPLHPALRQGHGRRAERGHHHLPPGPPPADRLQRRGLPQPAADRVRPGHPELDVDVNGPGDIFSLDRVNLIAELNASPSLLPYGEVLEGILAGDPLLSVRGDTAEDCWRIIEPVLRAWARGTVPWKSTTPAVPGPLTGPPRSAG